MYHAHTHKVYRPQTIMIAIAAINIFPIAVILLASGLKLQNFIINRTLKLLLYLFESKTPDDDNWGNVNKQEYLTMENK